MKKIADAVLVAMMLMASVPGLADNMLDRPAAAVEEQISLTDSQEER